MQRKRHEAACIRHPLYLRCICFHSFSLSLSPLLLLSCFQDCGPCGAFYLRLVFESVLQNRLQLHCIGLSFILSPPQHDVECVLSALQVMGWHVHLHRSPSRSLYHSVHIQSMLGAGYSHFLYVSCLLGPLCFSFSIVFHSFLSSCGVVFPRSASINKRGPGKSPSLNKSGL